MAWRIAAIATTTTSAYFQSSLVSIFSSILPEDRDAARAPLPEQHGGDGEPADRREGEQPTLPAAETFEPVERFSELLRRRSGPAAGEADRQSDAADSRRRHVLVGDVELGVDRGRFPFVAAPRLERQTHTP